MDETTQMLYLLEDCFLWPKPWTCGGNTGRRLRKLVRNDLCQYKSRSSEIDNDVLSLQTFRDGTISNSLPR